MRRDIELCICYTTTGFPSFKPLCHRGHRASLKCHSVNPDCLDYRQTCENAGHCANTEGCMEWMHPKVEDSSKCSS